MLKPWGVNPLNPDNWIILRMLLPNLGEERACSWKMFWTN